MNWKYRVAQKTGTLFLRLNFKPGAAASTGVQGSGPPPPQPPPGRPARCA